MCHTYVMSSLIPEKYVTWLRCLTFVCKIAVESFHIALTHTYLYSRKSLPGGFFYLHRSYNPVFTVECYSFRSAILEEVQNQGNTKLPSNKNVLVLGDNETGKTTLIAKLQGVEDPKKGSALEYAYIDVRDEYRDGKFVCLSVTHFL